MKKGFLAKPLLPIAFASLVLLSLTGISQSFDKDFIDGQVYFKFKDNVRVDIPVNADRIVDLDDAPFLDAIRRQFDIKGLSRPFNLNNDPKLLRTFELDFSQFEKIEAIMAELVKNPDFEYVEKVPLPHIYFSPDDSLYNYYYGYNNWNWHLDVINAEAAWDLNTGSADIKIAIVDNAVWVDHPDLADKIVLSTDVTTPGNQNSNPPTGGDAEKWSHGTHCAGLAASETNNWIGVASIGYNVSLMGVKASTTNPENIAYGYAGIQWAANNGADVISLSWGNSSYNQTNQNLITTVHNMGIVILGAAGNDNLATPQYPASYNYVISVASTDEDDVKTDFSNYSTSVDISAPGGYGIHGPQGLMSTTWELTNFGYYDFYAGTSMACPLAAGLCGLMLSVNPALTPDELENILESACDEIDTIAENEDYVGMLGAGRINAYKAVLNTPFTPAADFYTPVPYLKPGTGIQFFDLSAGVPESWSWEFSGGTPHLSSQQNPTVYFSSEGEYTVYLGVTNDFGTDVETKTNYITVTSTPVPWVLFSASTDTACNGDTIVFADETLYDPTSWTWEFQPSSVTFTDGTSLNSQNPHVRFDLPGYYSVTLTAANVNGSNFKTITDMIFIKGIIPNFSEDFETGTCNSFDLNSNSRARVGVDYRAAAPASTYGLHFQGSSYPGGWIGSPNNTTPEQAWNTNVDFHGFADNCSVDASGIEGVKLTFDLRQTYSIGYTYSWFRVMVNGVQIADVDGNVNFNPATNTDPFDLKTFDLSQFGNSAFNVSFQSSCFLMDKYYDQGDNAFIDNIMISNTTGAKEGTARNTGVLTYPNPVTGVLNYSANGTGSMLTVKVLNTQGQIIWQESFKGYKDGDVRQINTGNFNSGVYILQLNGDKGSTIKKFVIE